MDTKVRDVCEGMPSDLISCSSHEERAGQYCNGKGRVLGGQCGLPLVSISVDWFLQRSSFTQKIVSTEKRPEFLDIFSVSLRLSQNLDKSRKSGRSGHSDASYTLTCKISFKLVHFRLICF